MWNTKRGKKRMKAVKRENGERKGKRNINKETIKGRQSGRSR